MSNHGGGRRITRRELTHLDKADRMHLAQACPRTGTSLSSVAVPQNLHELLVRVDAADLCLVQFVAQRRNGTRNSTKLWSDSASPI